MMKYRIISYYTIGTLYEQEVCNLRASLDKFNLPNKIYPKQSMGSWEKNCQQKALVIRDALNEFPNECLIWTDADSVLMKPPSFFDSLNENDFDLVYHILKTTYNPNEVLSGTVVFNNNTLVKNIVDDWIALNSTNTAFDQKNFQQIIESDKYKSTIRVIPLPSIYIKINKHDKYQPGIDPNEVVICHYQLSRITRGKIK